MGLFELFVLAVGLSMDAFAVSVCKGLAVRRAGIREMAAAGAWFGGFQAIMPLAGYFLGVRFKEYITAFDHWIAFVLLVFIGGRMLWESLSRKDGEDTPDGSLDFKTMLALALATSIDALAVGVTLAFLEVDILPAIMFIGGVTFVISALGIQIGNLFGEKYRKGAEIAGGAILIGIGIKILLEHLGIL